MGLMAASPPETDEQATARVLWQGSVAVFIVGVALSALWWGILFPRASYEGWMPGAFPWLLAFGGVQLFAWLLMALALIRTRRMVSWWFQVTLLVIGAGILCSSLLYYFTPALGAPLAIPFLVALVILHIELRRSSM